MDKFFDFDEQATLFEDMSGFTFTELSQAIECIFRHFGVGVCYTNYDDTLPCTGRRLFTIFTQYEWLRRISYHEDKIVVAVNRTELARFNDMYGSTYHGLAGTVLLNLMDMHASALSGLVGAVTRWDELPPESKKQIATWELEHNHDDLHKLAFTLRSERLIYEQRLDHHQAIPATPVKAGESPIQKTSESSGSRESRTTKDPDPSHWEVDAKQNWAKRFNISPTTLRNRVAENPLDFDSEGLSTQQLRVHRDYVGQHEKK